MTQPLGDAMARVLRMPEVVDDAGSARLTAWLVGESGDFVGAQRIATVETDSALLGIEVAEPGVLVRSLVAPGQRVKPGSALALLASTGEVIEDVEQLMVKLGLAVASHAQVAGSHLRSQSPDDPLGSTTWNPLQTVPAERQDTAAPAEIALIETMPRDSWSSGPDIAPPVDAAVAPILGWVDAVADAIVTATRGEARADARAVGLRQVRLRGLIRADALMSVIATVDTVSLIGLVVKAVANTCRVVPLQPETSTIAALAVQRRTPSGTVAPVVHVANLMTASSLTSIVADLDARARQGRTGAGELEPACVLIVDLAEQGVAEGALDATEVHPAVLVVGQVRAQAVVEDGVLVPALVLGVTMSCDANRIDVPTASRWFGELSRMLEEPLRFLT